MLIAFNFYFIMPQWIYLDNKKIRMMLDFVYRKHDDFPFKTIPSMSSSLEPPHRLTRKLFMGQWAGPHRIALPPTAVQNRIASSPLDRFWWAPLSMNPPQNSPWICQNYRLARWFLLPFFLILRWDDALRDLSDRLMRRCSRGVGTVCEVHVTLPGMKGRWWTAWCLDVNGARFRRLKSSAALRPVSR